MLRYEYFSEILNTLKTKCALFPFVEIEQYFLRIDTIKNGQHKKVNFSLLCIYIPL